jgi:hypothetical protein
MYLTKRSVSVFATIVLSLGLVWSPGGGTHPATRAAHEATAAREGMRGALWNLIDNLKQIYELSADPNSFDQPIKGDPGNGGETPNFGSSLDPNG